MVPDVSIKLVDMIPAPDALALYRAAGWWNSDDDPTVLPDIIAGSFLVCVAVTGDGRHVGMGRMISDGRSDGYIQDVIVFDEYRRKGIGGQIVRMLFNEGQERGLRWIGLIAAPGTAGFYSSLGFSEMPGHTPMLLDMTKKDPDE